MGTILKKGLSPLSTAWVGVSDCRRAKTLVFGGLPAPKKRWAGGVQGGLLCSKGVGELKKVHGISDHASRVLTTVGQVNIPTHTALHSSKPRKATRRQGARSRISMVIIPKSHTQTGTHCGSCRAQKQLGRKSTTDRKRAPLSLLLTYAILWHDLPFTRTPRPF